MSPPHTQSGVVHHGPRSADGFPGAGRPARGEDQSHGRGQYGRDTSATGPWIDLPTARELCATTNLSENFRPLLAFREAQRAQETPILSKPLQIE